MGVLLGFIEKRSPATPDACGAAMEVPPAQAYQLFLYVLSISTPGA